MYIFSLSLSFQVLQGMGRQLQDSRMPNSSSVCLASKSLVLPHSRVLPPLLSGDCKHERTGHFENTCFDICIYVLSIYVHTHTHNVYRLFMCARTQAKKKNTHTNTKGHTHKRKVFLRRDSFWGSFRRSHCSGKVLGLRIFSLLSKSSSAWAPCRANIPNGALQWWGLLRGGTVRHSPSYLDLVRKGERELDIIWES